ncbi:hypothetical protein [Paenibacillus sp. 1P03SA]|uniref:hypothetical protein n=1 Tax=Paenibacillus sp. 1P03SA TaxID=3132294 RepID=UPI00399FC7F0
MKGSWIKNILGCPSLVAGIRYEQSAELETSGNPATGSVQKKQNGGIVAAVS